MEGGGKNRDKEEKENKIFHLTNFSTVSLITEGVSSASLDSIHSVKMKPRWGEFYYPSRLRRVLANDILPTKRNLFMI